VNKITNEKYRKVTIFFVSLYKSMSKIEKIIHAKDDSV